MLVEFEKVPFSVRFGLTFEKPEPRSSLLGFNDIFVEKIFEDEFCVIMFNVD
jgi:hypothetical protein